MWLNRWHWIGSSVVISHRLSILMLACALSSRTVFHIWNHHSAAASATITTTDSLHCIGFKKFYRDLLVKTTLFLWLLRLRSSDSVRLFLNNCSILISHTCLNWIWLDPFGLLEPFEWFGVEHFFLIAHRHYSSICVAIITRGRFPTFVRRTFALSFLEAIFVHELLLCAIVVDDVSILNEIVLRSPSLRWDS